MIWLEVGLPLFVYLVGALFTFGRVASAYAWEEAAKSYRNGRPDWGEGVFIGVINAPLWPLTLPIWLALWKNRQARMGIVGGWLFRPPPHLAETARNHLEREREAYIKRLEQKAGIR